LENFLERVSISGKPNAFETSYKEALDRAKSIKEAWALFAVLLFLSLVSLFVYLTNYLVSQEAVYFIPFACFSIGMSLVLIRIKHLKRRQQEPSLASLFSGNIKNLEKVLATKNKLPNFFFKDDSGTIYKITQQIWTAQYWFLLLSSNEQHRFGISMNRTSTAGELLTLKSEFEEFLSVINVSILEAAPHNRKCLELRAIQNNKKLLGKFISAAKKDLQSSSANQSRNEYLNFSKVIYAQWDTWKLYKNGNLKGAIKDKFELDLIFALTGSRKRSDKHIKRLAKYTKPDVRAFNKWIKNLDIVSQDDLEKYMNTSS